MTEAIYTASHENFPPPLVLIDTLDLTSLFHFPLFLLFYFCLSSVFPLFLITSSSFLSCPLNLVLFSVSQIFFQCSSSLTLKYDMSSPLSYASRCIVLPTPHLKTLLTADECNCPDDEGLQCGARWLTVPEQLTCTTWNQTPRHLLRMSFWHVSAKPSWL